jgi:hypothetical protein
MERAENWAADKNVTSRSYEVIKVADGRLSSISEEYPKKCDHVGTIEDQYECMNCYTLRIVMSEVTVDVRVEQILVTS